MRRLRLLGLFLLLLGLVAGCGSDEPAGPTFDRSSVAGVYHLGALTFDPQGSLPRVDILDRLSPADRPDLTISYTDDTFQLVFRAPLSGLVRVAKGRYSPDGDQIELNFDHAEDAQSLLLPKRSGFDFDRGAMPLSYAATSYVSLVRLRELVPEFRTEQLPVPVLGELVVVFEYDRR